MLCDYRDQQPGEHDFDYAARILRAASNNFSGMLANDSYSFDDLRKIKQHVLGVVAKCIDSQLKGK